MKARQQKKEKFNPAAVKAHFVSKDSNYHAWARSKGFSPQLVYLVIHNRRATGPESSRVVAALKKELGQ